jgi:excinuclease ABC subunit B
MSTKKTPSRDDLKGMPKDELKLLIKHLEAEMKEAANDLDFERAAVLRDQIVALKSIKKF